MIIKTNSTIQQKKKKKNSLVNDIDKLFTIISPNIKNKKIIINNVITFVCYIVSVI